MKYLRALQQPACKIGWLFPTGRTLIVNLITIPKTVFTLCWIAFRGTTESYPVKYKHQRPGAAQGVHTHQTSCRRGWPGGFGALNSSPHSWIFTSVSVGSSPRSYLNFRDGPNRCTKVWHKTYPTRDAQCTFEIGAAHPRSVTEIASLKPFLCVTEALFVMIFMAA